MKFVAIPRHLHELFGRTQHPAELAAVLGVSFALASGLLVLERHDLVVMPWWRIALVSALVLDIVAGCLANFTQGTNDYYAASPRRRWLFIALHVHVLAIALALRGPFRIALAVWAWTVAGTSVVTLLQGHRAQVLVAGSLLTIGLMALALVSQLSRLELVAYQLYMLKLLVAFGVGHGASLSRLR
jgi:hypothetical protein